MNKRVSTYVRAFDRFIGMMEVIRNPFWDSSTQTLEVPITENPSNLSDVVYDGYYSGAHPGRHSSSHAFLAKIAELDGSPPVVRHTVSFKTTVSGDRAFLWWLFKNPEGNLIAEYNSATGSFNAFVIQGIREDLGSLGKAEYKVNFGGQSIELQSGDSEDVESNDAYKKALKFTINGQERIITLDKEGTVFKKCDNSLFSSLDIGTVLADSCIEFLQSGLHAFRYEKQEQMPWVFAGISGGFGYDFY